MKYLIFTLAVLVATVVCGGSSRFDRVSRTYTQQLVASPQTILPLLTPLKESLWADGWQADMIYPVSGEPVPGSIFTTHAGEKKTVWTMTRYDPESFRVEYFLVHPDHHVRQIVIALTENTDHSTAAQITFSYTALDEEGNQAVAEFTQEKWKHQMLHWETALNHYLKTGRKLTQQK